MKGEGREHYLPIIQHHHHEVERRCLRRAGVGASREHRLCCARAASIIITCLLLALVVRFLQQQQRLPSLDCSRAQRRIDAVRNAGKRPERGSRLAEGLGQDTALGRFDECGRRNGPARRLHGRPNVHRGLPAAPRMSVLLELRQCLVQASAAN